MIVTFCGHARFSKSEEHEQQILAFLEEKIGDQPADMYLGGYGSFDSFAYSCTRKYKENHPDCKLVYITPYNSIEQQKKYNEYEKNRFDFVLYPELECVPPKYAISHRNRWISEKADIIIAYITHEYGGAYAMYLHAKRRNKLIFNIALYKKQNKI